MMARKVTLQIAVACAALCWITTTQAQQPGTDSIGGKWAVTFTVEGQTVSGQMSFQASGQKLDGNVETVHTGRGELNGGAWSHSKLSGIYTFEGHEAIAIAGELRAGKLIGVFQTEGRDGKWEAVRVGTEQ